MYSPSLEFEGVSQTAWLPRFEREAAAGRRPAAIATALLGTHRTVLRFVPRVLVNAGAGLLVRLLERAQAKDDSQALPDPIAVIRNDALLVREAAGPLGRFSGLTCDVLLLRDAKSTRNLAAASDGLVTVLPHARSAVLPRARRSDIKPVREAELLAAELRQFFR